MLEERSQSAVKNSADFSNRCNLNLARDAAKRWDGHSEMAILANYDIFEKTYHKGAAFTFIWMETFNETNRMIDDIPLDQQKARGLSRMRPVKADIDYKGEVQYRQGESGALVVRYFDQSTKRADGSLGCWKEEKYTKVNDKMALKLPLLIDDECAENFKNLFKLSSQGGPYKVRLIPLSR